jgi:hypothetical protein
MRNIRLVGTFKFLVAMGDPSTRRRSFLGVVLVFMVENVLLLCWWCRRSGVWQPDGKGTGHSLVESAMAFSEINTFMSFQDETVSKSEYGFRVKVETRTL